MLKSEKIMFLVRLICEAESTDCRSLNKVPLARKLMNHANIPASAEISEIPLDWDNQVEILFFLPDDKNCYSLFAGIGNDGQFHFDLTITGFLVWKDGEQVIDYLDEEEEIGLSIDHFQAVSFNRREIL